MSSDDAGIGGVPEGQAGLGIEFDFSQVLTIADALPMLVASVGPDQRYRFVNRAFSDFFKRPRREILGRTMAEVMGPDAYAMREGLIRAALAGERQWFAAEYPHPSRGMLAVQTEYLPQRAGPDGPVQGLVVLVQDVTEQRVSERALRESEARFRRIADSAPVMMWVTRLDRRRDFVNDAYLEFAGITPAQTHSHDWHQWIHPDDRERIAQDSAAGEASGQPFTLEGRFRRADGAWRWLRSVSSPRFGPDGELVGFIGAAIDVTLAKEAEEQLRRLVEERTAELSASDALFRAVFDSALELMALLRTDGTVLELNRTAATLTRLPPEEIVGRKLWDAPPIAAIPETRAAVKRLIDRALAGESARAEVAFKVGSERKDVIGSITPVRDGHGAPLYLVAEAHDISELKVAQEQLRQSQKMEALGQLTGGIAHDFNNLLTVVVGGLDLIVKRLEDEKLRRYAQNALEAAERGARLTAQLLAFSRVQRLEVRPTLVTPLIEGMRPLLRNVLGPGIEKKFELDGTEMPVLADPTQLELAVLNLAINARDAMAGGGSLAIRTAKLAIDGDPDLEPGDYIELSISDTGTGMPPEVAERAFEPFFTTKEVGKGTGLGLSMVYGVARQSGGVARIESRVGEGTTVRLYFRRAQDAPPLDPPEGTGSEEAPVVPAGTVLVVDDDADVRSFIAGSLEESGYVVREVGDGAAAMARFQEEPPDLVVLDFVMPGMSGAEVARLMLEERPRQPILFVSGYSETDAIRRVAPGAPLLPKPFRADALRAAVRGVLPLR
jgi:PAS domain S-box-containing protein